MSHRFPRKQFWFHKSTGNIQKSSKKLSTSVFVVSRIQGETPNAWTNISSFLGDKKVLCRSGNWYLYRYEIGKRVTKIELQTRRLGTCRTNLNQIVKKTRVYLCMLYFDVFFVKFLFKNVFYLAIVQDPIYVMEPETRSTFLPNASPTYCTGYKTSQN